MRGKALNAEGSRSLWRIILSEGIKRGIDPYEYLQGYLTPSELQRVQDLPQHCKEQIDLMISIADEYSACDDEIKSLVYRLFGVK